MKKLQIVIHPNDFAVDTLIMPELKRSRFYPLQNYVRNFELFSLGPIYEPNNITVALISLYPYVIV